MGQGDRESERHELERWLISRRAFVLGATGVLTGATAVDALAEATKGHRRKVIAKAAAQTDASTGLHFINPLPGTQGTTLLVRREDFLLLQVDTLSNGTQTWMVFSFPPQAVVEQAWPGVPGAPGATAAMLSHPSRLAFLLNGAGDAPNLADLLAWDGSGPLNLSPSYCAVATFDPFEYHYPNADGTSIYPSIVEPGPHETAIELPWHLVLSPMPASDFQQTGQQLTSAPNGTWNLPTASYPSTDPSAPAVSLGGRFELWHARLAVDSKPTTPDGGIPLRAVWNFDVENGKPTLTGLDGDPPYSRNPPFDGDGRADDPPFQQIQGLTQFDRYNIVRATSDFGNAVDANNDFASAPLSANRLWLSARGGYLDVNGQWDFKPGTISLQEWDHVTTLGRDQYVKVVDRGFLFPWGHRATQIKITERVFSAVGTNEVAGLQETFYFIIHQPVNTYGMVDFPFEQIEVKTLTTGGTAVSPLGSGNPGAVIPQATAGGAFQFHMVGTDLLGRQIGFTTGAAFVKDEGNGQSTNLNTLTVRSAYNALFDTSSRIADLQGQTVSFGPHHTPGDTDLKVSSLTFGAVPLSDPDVVDFAPSLALSYYDGGTLRYTNAQASVTLSGAETLSGGGQLGGNPLPSFAYHPKYVNNGPSLTQGGFGGANQGNVFLTTAAHAGNAVNDLPGNLTFGNGSAGGLMTPNIAIQGLSRSLGPIADPDNIFAGKFDPTQFFAGLESATFLGGLKLTDIIDVVTNIGSAATGAQSGGITPASGTPDDPSSSVPQLSYTTSGTSVITTVNWSPIPKQPASSAPSDPTNPDNDNLWIDFPPNSSDFPANSPNFSAVFKGTITTDVANPQQPPSFSFAGDIGPFTFTLLSKQTASFIAVTFSNVHFAASTGSKTKVVPSITGVSFLGPLMFLQDLEEAISEYSQFGGDDGGGGLKVTVDGKGVTIDLSVAIPPIALGLFTLSGIGFDVSVNIPLDGVGMATFTFAFASATSPFQIGGGIFGGGGYFNLVIGTKHLRSVTISINFGAMISIDLGVASGGVKLVAFITFLEGPVTETINGKSVTTPDACSLTAGVTLSGHLQVLGIVTLSLEFDLVLTWDITNHVLSGEATLQVGISLLCLHTTVSVTAKKTFSGSSSDTAAIRGRAAPANATAYQMAYSDWQSYCSGFVGN